MWIYICFIIISRKQYNYLRGTDDKKFNCKVSQRGLFVEVIHLL